MKSVYIRRFIAAAVIAVILAYAFGEFVLKENYATLGTVDRKIMEIEGTGLSLVEGRGGYCMLVDSDGKEIASLKPLKADYKGTQIGDFLVTYSRSGDGIIDIKKTLQSGKAEFHMYDDIVLSDDNKYMAVREGNESYIKTLGNKTVSELGDCWVSYMGDGYLVTSGEKDKSYIRDLNTGEILYTVPDKESICGRSAGMWIMGIRTGFDDVYYYLRDSNFNVVCEGVIFTDVAWSDDYVGGAVIDGADYESKEKIENSLFGSDFAPVKNLILSYGGEIVYETEVNHSLKEIIGDYAVFEINGGGSEGDKKVISLAPETRGQEVPEEQAYMSEEVKS